MSSEGAPGAAPLVPFLTERARLVEEGWDEGAERRLAELMSTAVVELAGDLPSQTCVVGIGGFGRQVMAINSDVDLLFLGPSSGAGDVEPRVLRPLWDARMKVGHLSHTPRDARIFAGTRLDAISTFLTARPLAGDTSVFDEFWKLFQRLLEKEHLQIVRMMEDEERARRQAEPYRLMAANLKTGRGGIRTLDMVDWRRRLFGEAGVEVEPQRRDEDLRRDLTRFRSAIHVASNRMHDGFDFDLREKAASWLGTTVRELGRAILEARTRSEHLVDSVWPRLRSSERHPNPLDGAGDLLRAFGPSERDRLHLLDSRSAIAAMLPDWDRLRDQPHTVPFHEYSVGDHILATVDEAHTILSTPEDPVVREALSGVDRPELLLWAALLHDVGKGLPGDHSRVGAERAEELCRDLGLGDDTELMTTLVRHHLLLADLATRHDLDDPKILSWAGDRIGDHTTLRLLFLLTVADSRATGTDTWSPWRAELVRRAYRRMERELNQRSIPEEMKVAVLADRVVEAGDGSVDLAEVTAHLTGFGEVYRTGHSPDEILDHIVMSRAPLGLGGVTVRVHPGTPARVMVMTGDRPGLLLAVAGVVALARLSIVDARFATRSDGRVFDTFDVVRMDGRSVDTAEAVRLSERLEHTIRRGFDLSGEVAAKRRDYRSVERTGIEPRITIARLAGGGGVVEVECADRVGLLFDLAEVFDEYGMPVIRARLDTRAGMAYDTFQVDRLPTPTDPLEERLAAATR